MPILKNGSDPNLGLVTIESTKFSLKNTCAFDSIFQILLAGVADHDEVKNCVQDNAHFNPLFEMITEAARSKIQSKTYRSRAEILLKFFKKTPKKNCIEEIFCQCNVVSLGNFLFSSTPSYQEISICPAGCPPRITSLPSITITGKEIHLPLGRVIEDHIVIPGVSCKQTGCREEENNQIHEIGKIVMVGLDCDENMTIESIPKSFECPKTGQEYGFLGAVLYQGPTVMTRRISAIGHYVALTKRGQKWTIYDDLHQKSTSVMKTVRVKPELIFYFKK
ncbi:uncharacterized protein LOC126892568 [Diabrotica virgifera virgifera]|uniref:USP domain-containing protein n=1 Tax=Diabrotica virgifera virgifera TaxID=50390 RepID=A0ABM5L6M9_DIAVI|nr:uncharacterized protein LOC126892568 [Diabrotica virgifera virgifera]